MQIEYLADHTNAIPTIAQWAYEEWAYLHPERTYTDVERLIAEGSNKEGIPISLVATVKGKVIGWAVLKASDFKARPNLGPWLGGLFVEKQYRRKGVGTRLVREIEGLSARLGVGRLFLVTDDVEDFYSGLGWSVRERVESKGISVVVMETEIAECGGRSSL